MKRFASWLLDVFKRLYTSLKKRLCRWLKMLRALRAGLRGDMGLVNQLEGGPVSRCEKKYLIVERISLIIRCTE